MKFKFLFFMFLAMAGLLSAQSTAPAPKIGDYKSVTSGAWTATSTWNVYDGSTWVSTSTYPGQATAATAQANYSVFVEPGTDVSVSGIQTYYFGNLYILADPIPTPGNVVSYGKVTLADNPSELILLGDNQDVIILGGILDFANQNTELKLKLGNSLVLKYYNGGSSCNTGTNLLQPERTPGTNGTKQIKFVDGATEYNYAVSGGGNSDYNFFELNCNGGSLDVVPEVAPNPVCAGKTVNFTTTTTGFVSGADMGTPKYYTWNLVSGPAGYTFTPTSPSTSGNMSLILTLPGTYVYNVRIAYQSTLGYEISANQTVTVEVLSPSNPLCGGGCFKDPALDTVKHPSKHGITSLQRAGAKNPDNWPMVRESAYTVLESDSKGFVINRLTTAQLNAIVTAGNAVDGMMAYDTTENCLKLYVKDADASKTGWFCFSTPACPN